MTIDAADHEALDWAIRSGDPAFDDWDALTAWLEADGTRAIRYHAAAAGLADVTAALRTVPPSAATMPVRRGRAPTRWIVGGALAAAIAGTIGYRHIPPAPQPYAVATAPGQMRTVALADGSRITLAGGTRVALDRADDRVATVERGQALFTIRHDDAHPFRVTAAGERMVDTGTVFSVALEREGLTVAVAEGGVRLGEGGDTIDLGAGQRVQVRDGGATRSVARVAPPSVGAWTTGQLSYAGAPVAEVAGEVARALGATISVAPAIAIRPFSGTLSLAALRRDPAALGPLVNGVMVRDGDGWELRAKR